MNQSATDQNSTVLTPDYTQVGALRFELVSKSFTLADKEVNAVQDLNFTVNPGEFVALMGSSGSGKTTTLNMLGLLDTPTAGTYSVGGTSTTGLSQAQKAHLRKNTFGFIFQNFNLLDRYTVVQNIELAMMYQRVSSSASRSLALDLLRQLGLADKAHARPHQLSGGQAQRIAIARALINNPPIVLADEPTGNLDESSAQEIVQLLHTLNKRGTTVIMVTHSKTIALSASRIISMSGGKIISDRLQNA